MSTQTPVGVIIPATRTVRRATEVAVFGTTFVKLYLRLDEMANSCRGLQGLSSTSRHRERSRVPAPVYTCRLNEGCVRPSSHLFRSNPVPSALLPLESGSERQNL